MFPRLSYFLTFASLGLLLSGCRGTAEPPPPDVFSDFEACGGSSRTTLRRLNRAEYDNTVRDLLGDTSRPARAFPADPFVSFDNNADALALTPLQLELYESAAEKLVETALHPPEAVSVRYEAEALAAKMCPGGETPEGVDYTCYGFLSPQSLGSAVAAVMWEHKAWVETVHPVTIAGEYRISVAAFRAQPAVPATLEVLVDGVRVHTGTVGGTAAAPVVVQVPVKLSAGGNRIQVRNGNVARAYERDLGLDGFTVEGPLDAAIDEQRAYLDDFFRCEPEGEDIAPCAREILGPFARRAFRRTVTVEELDELVSVVRTALDEGDDFRTGIRLAVRRILVSADFLYRVELDGSPDASAPVRLTGPELASRLSYFLWSTTPDDHLLEAGIYGELHSPQRLQAHVRRLVAHPRADVLAERFAAQWLRTTQLEAAQPSPAVFPGFDESLRAAMAEETRLMFRAFFRENRNALDLLDAPFTFVNERLAQHYGLSGVTGPQFQRVELPKDGRGGLFAQASILTLTSTPTRTSPVKRGKWVLGQLLCDEPPPPPPGVPALDESQVSGGNSLRETLEAHRANPACAGCHETMEPIGLALEQFDGVGGARDKTGLDLSATLGDGRSFVGAEGLAQTLKADPELARCMTQQVLTYALGRELTRADECTVNAVTRRFADSGYRLHELFYLVTQTEPFLKR